MRRLCTRGKYLGIKEDTYELPYGILAFLLGEFKSLKKGSVNPFLPTGLVKEKDRGERKFKVFKTESCLFPSTVLLLECALTLARDLAYIWPRCPHPILSVCNSSIRL
jgi:hypothetical protein